MIGYVFEFFFLLSIVLKFTTSYVIQGETVVIKSHSKIAKRYLQDDFILDLIPLFPIQLIFLSVIRNGKLFYLLKCIRVIKVAKIFDIGALFKTIQTAMKNRNQRLIEESPEVGEDFNIDHNNIKSLMFIKYVFKLVKLLLIIVNISYFSGMFFLIFCEVTKEWLQTILNKNVDYHFKGLTDATCLEAKFKQAKNPWWQERWNDC